MLAQLIREAFDTQPGPDMARLERIETRLSRQRNPEERIARVNTLPWWIVLLLTAGFATAAWWAGEAWLGNKPAPPVNEQRETEKSGVGPGKTERDEARELHIEQEKPQAEEQPAVIYRREKF